MTERNSTTATHSTKVITQQLNELADAIDEAIALHHFFYEAIDGIFTRQINHQPHYEILHHGMTLVLNLLRQYDVSIQKTLRRLQI